MHKVDIVRKVDNEPRDFAFPAQHARKALSGRLSPWSFPIILRVGLRIGHQLDPRTLPTILSAAKITAATQTIDGPAGVSNM